MIQDFIKILRNAELEPTAIDIAEMLLLAAYMPAPLRAQPVDPDSKEPGKTGTTSGTPPSKGGSLRPASALRPSEAEDAGGLFAETDEEYAEGEGGVETVPFRTPKASALPGGQKIARALRPLRRRHPSNRRFVLDEETTIQRIADGGPHSPVMKPAPERWLDVALVFDQSLTMRLWRPTLTELQHLFERCGIFRDVRSWGLDADGARATLHSATGPQGLDSARSWRELLDPARRRLIVVVSDCHGESWHNGDAYRLLVDWGKQAPVALVQVLPERFWHSTTMTPVDARLRAYRSGLVNQRLEVSPAWYGDLVRAGGWPLPVVTLDEWSIAPWARMIAGSSGVTSLGLVIPPLPDRDAKREAPSQKLGKAASKSVALDESQPPSARDRVKTFLAHASPPARQLASYLASAPLSLPVMQLVQQAMLPGSRQSHLAEVFLGGLIYQPAPKGDRKPKPDEILFEFYDGVRDELINRVTKAETVTVIDAVTRYIEQRIGEGGEFDALLALPGKGTGGPRRRLDPLSRRFAQLSSSILRRFGGYESRVSHIESLFNLDAPISGTEELPSDAQGVESLLSLASARLQEGRISEAEAYYRDILKASPADERAWHGLAEIARRGLPGAESMQLMRALLRDPDELTRKVAAEAVGKVGDQWPALIEGLAESLWDESELVKTAALESLRLLGAQDSTATSSAFIGLLRRPDARVREKAALLLGELGGPFAISALRDALMDDDPGVRRAAADALEALGAPAVEEGKRVKIFLSYAREDQEKVLALHRMLLAAGFDPWLDREALMAGQRWEPVIRQSLRDSDFVLICLSTTSIRKQGFMQKEIRQALDHAMQMPSGDVGLIPVRLEECTIPEALAHLHWVDLFDEQGFEALRRAIEYQVRKREEEAAESSSASVDTSVFEFETVTLDERGRELERRRLAARQYIETLSEGVALEMVEIPGGEFLMGSPKSEANSYDDERPQHKVTIQPFYMGKFAITQAQWRAIAADTTLKVSIDLEPAPSRFKGDDRPVENVSWNDAKEFCARLSKKTRLEYRLPTEAEWEYACRAGTTAPFAFGETITHETVNNNSGYPYAKAEKKKSRGETVAVGSLGVANAFGLYDMHGNVWEWCEDVWHNGYKKAPADGSVWLSGGDSSLRVLRGGSWASQSFVCRSAYRYDYGPDARNGNNGFRVVVGARVP